MGCMVKTNLVVWQDGQVLEVNDVIKAYSVMLVIHTRRSTIWRGPL